MHGRRGRSASCIVSARAGARLALFVIAASLAASLAAGLAGCDTVGFAPPVEYRAVSIERGDRGALHAIAGLYLELASVATRTIVEAELGFDLFLDDRPHPARGANSFAVVVPLTLDPGGRASLCVSLDSAVASAEGSLSFSRARAVSVTFADGQRWRNPGTHIYREEEADGR